MDAGELTAFIALKKKIVARDLTTNNETVTYQVILRVSAKPEFPGSPSEVTSLEQQQASFDVLFTIYRRIDIQSDWRVEWRGEDYELIGPPTDLQGRKEWTQLLCRTAQL